MSHCSPSTWDVTYVFPDALQFTHKHPFEAAKSPLSHWQTCPDMFVASSDLLLFAADSCWNHGLHGWFPRVLPAHVGGSQFHESVNWTYDVAAIVPPSTVGGEKWRWHRNSWKVYVASRWGPFWVGYHKFLNVNSVLFNQYSILCQKKIPIFQCSHAKWQDIPDTFTPTPQPVTHPLRFEFIEMTNTWFDLDSPSRDP